MRKAMLPLLLAFSLAIHLVPGALAGVAGPWEPRLSRLTAPELPLESRPYDGEAVRGSYVPGASLALTESGAICVSPFDSTIFIEAYNEWEDGEAWVDTWENSIGIHISNIICVGSEWAYIEGNAVSHRYPEYVCVPRDGAYGHDFLWPGDPSEIRLSADDPPCVGPMLRMADNGRLLFAGADGKLRTAEMNGDDVLDIEGVIASEFVYHDGVIYFANLDDIKIYADVYYEFPLIYDDSPSEPVDLLYPRLYRVNLDGTGLEKLTECGVRGLVSQGPYIAYQNLDDAFITLGPDLAGPRYMYGALYRYNAGSGEHSPLFIESDRYFATPRGIAVWYHTFDIEPYEVDAELVLHAFDGTPLCRLDAGACEMYGSFGFGDDEVVFCSAVDWWTGEYAFVTVLLDGGARREGLPNADADELEGDTISVSDMRDIPLDAEELEMWGYLLSNEDIKAIAKLKELRRLYLFDNCITDISPLSCLENLEELNLGLNDIADISPLAGMSRLETLDLYQNDRLTDLTPLYQLPSLRCLNVSSIEIRDLSVLSPLTGLRELGVSECEVKDLAPLAGLTALEVLYLSVNEELTDITPLEGMTEMRCLHLSTTGVTDLSVLSSMELLEELDLSGCSVHSLSILAELKNLKILNLRAIGLTDLSPLYALTALEQLDIRANDALTLESFNLLKEKLPNTRIISEYAGVGGVTSVTIPDGTTIIGTGAYSGYVSLTCITIPDGVWLISNSAFRGCKGLTGVTMPDSLKTIDNLAFAQCTGLTSVTIPGGVTSIGGMAFYDCTSLTSVTIPASVTDINKNAFSGCGELTLYVTEGSYAALYAEENGIPYSTSR